MKKIYLIVAIFSVFLSAWSKEPVIAPSFAWEILPPLGLHKEATIDTALYNYYQQAIPSAISPAYATTGNMGSEGINMIYFERKPMSDFFFQDALSAWIPSLESMKFYNTRIPMTLLSYNTGGGRENTQDRLKATFSGNSGPKLQIGAMLDYIYSKGSYNYQASKGLIWGASGSYIGDRYELQTFFNHYNMLNKENGGITDDLYITDPAKLQGGETSIDAKAIPTNLSAAHSKIVGTQFYMNHRYKVGYYEEEYVNDTTVSRKYIPISSFIWTLDYKDGKHIFKNSNKNEDSEFWEDTYLTLDGTYDRTTYWSLRNTIGISLLEGFHKYAKAGLAAYATHEIRKFTQTTDTIDRIPILPEGLSPYPVAKVPTNADQNLLWIGAQLTKQRGSILTYNATAELGVMGDVAGDIKINGDIATRFNLFGDTVTISGYGQFKNEAVPYLMNHFVSNHFIWDNNFDKTRTLRFGGVLNIPHTRTRINIGAENIQNHVYFNEKCLPTQHGGSVQIFNAQLEQDFKVGILNWNNRLIYQTSSEQTVIPLPKFVAYSNLFLLFKVAKVLDVQFGVDCSYYSKYKSVAYQPATMSFYNQQEIECGNYPFMNAYINMKLSKARFYVMFTHVNQGLTGDNYFSIPHYPLNPRRFQLGVSVDFAN